MLSMLAGFLIGTSYIPFPPWALFFCVAPLFVAWARETSPRRALRDGWIAQAVFNVIGFHWVAYTAYEFGHLPLLLALLVLILFCATAHLYYAATGWATVRLGNWRSMQPAARIFLAASLLIVFEGIFPTLFPWHLGYPWLWAGWPGVQVGDVIGFEGLNVATIIVNALVAYAWIEWRHSARAPRARALRVGAIAVSAIALIAGLNIWGAARADNWKATDAELDVLAVQGNVGNYEKIYATRGSAYQGVILDKYKRLTREGLERYPQASAVIWPETGFPDNLDRPFLSGANQQDLLGFAHELGRVIFTGSYSEDVAPRAYYNGFFAVTPQGVVGDGYRKSILLSFGEYIPGSQYFPWVFKLIPSISSFGRGQGPMAMPAAGLMIGPQICYEGLYPEFTAGLARAGAEAILNITNDSWFGGGFEPRQHLYMTLARAIEFRRPLLRATNTGITTAILASGEILQPSPQNQEWSGLFKIKYRHSPAITFYQSIEETFSFAFWPCVLAMVAASLLVFANGRPFTKKSDTR